MPRQEYHVAVTVEGERIRVSGLIGRRTDLPVTHLSFAPLKNDPTM